MKYKFIKNLYQIISFAASELVLIFPIVLTPFLVSKSDPDYTPKLWLYTGIVVTSLICLYFLIGTYWIFQRVEINDKGIRVFWFQKLLREISWSDVEDISLGGVMRNPAYIIKVKSAKNLNLDSRKSIGRVLKYYCPNKFNG